MLSESEVRSRVRDALEVVTPPAPWLASSIQQAVAKRMQNGTVRRTPRTFRVSLRILSAAALIIVVIAGAATFLIARYSRPLPVPAGPSIPAHSTGWSYGGGVAMVTATDGWGYGLPFTHSTDAGVNWTDVTPKGAGQSFDEYYLDATHAWFVDWSGAGPYQFTTYQSADGGRTWQHGSPTSIGTDTDGLADHQVYFLDPDHGWLLLSKRDRTANGTPIYSDNLLRTDDGGLHWEMVAVHTAPPGWNPGKFYCYEWCGPMAFASAASGWLLTDSASDPTKPTILVTHDAGVTWRQQTLSLKTATIGCPCSQGPGPLIVFDDLHVVFQLYSRTSRRIALIVTSDGGVTWTPRALPVGEMKVGFYDVNHGWLIDQSALSTTSFTSPAQPLPLYVTADGGVSWTRVPTNLQLQSKDGQIISLYFIDQRNGFAIRANGASAGCVPSSGCTLVWSLLKTTDGGHTWSVVNPNL